MASAFPAPTGKDDRRGINQIPVIKVVMSSLVRTDREKIYLSKGTKERGPTGAGFRGSIARSTNN
jgi:hypothetical protein